MQPPLVQGDNKPTRGLGVVEYVHHHHERMAALVRTSLHLDPPPPPPLSKDQITCIKDPHMLHMIHLSWLLKCFEVILKPIGWNDQTAPPDTSYYLTIELLLKAVGESTEAELLAIENNQKRINDLFLDAWQSYEPSKAYYPVELYFLADAFTRKKEDTIWTVTLHPLDETVSTAATLLSKTKWIFAALQNHDAEGYLQALDGFHEVWSDFITALETEKKRPLWCGPFTLNTRLVHLSKASSYSKRRQRILELAANLSTDETNKDLLKVLTSEVESQLNKKLTKTPSIQCGIMTEAAAETICEIAKIENCRAALDELAQKDEIVFFNLVLQLSCLLMNKDDLSEKKIGPLFKPLLPAIATIHHKMEHLDCDYKEARHILIKSVLINHLKDKNLKKGLDSAFPAKKNMPPEDLDFLETELKKLFHLISRAWRKEMNCLYKQLLFDYRLLFLTKSIRLTTLAQEILELGLKRFHPVNLEAGDSHEITFLDKV